MRQLLQQLLPVSLLLTTGLGSLPAASSFCSDPLLLADRTYSDYRDGERGEDGRDGRAGRSGENVTVFADGNAINLELSGRDGEDGEDGERGRGSRCLTGPLEGDRSITLPSGGTGGRGGNGGPGGNGGSVTVYFTNLNALKQVYIRSQGGVGGRGGRGASGGQGCKCRRSSWDQRICRGTPGSSDYSCRTERYYCYDGRDGQRGSDGQDGPTGRLGVLSLIPQKTPLVPDAPGSTVSLAEAQNRAIPLSLNLWKTQRGAVTLLAPGSIVADEYRQFVERLESSFQLVWKSRRPLTEFADQSIALRLNEDRQVQVSFPQDVWVEGTPTYQQRSTLYTVTNVVRQSETTQLKVADFSGSRSQLTLALVDLAGKSDILNTEFQLTYRAAPRSATLRDRFGPPDYKTAYSGKLLPDLVKRDYNRFSLSLGKLPIDPELVSPGTAVEVELTVTRSLGSRSATQTISWTGEIQK